MNKNNIEPNGSRRGMVPMFITAFAIAPSFLPLGVFAAEPPPRAVICEAAGAVAPAQVVQVRPKVPGQIVRLLVESGATVKAGDLLAVMDDDKYKLEVERLKAKLDVAMSRYQELKTAQGQLGKASAAARLAPAQHQVRRAEIALREALPAASSIFPDGPDLVGMIPAKTNRIVPQGGGRFGSPSNPSIRNTDPNVPQGGWLFGSGHVAASGPTDPNVRQGERRFGAARTEADPNAYQRKLRAESLAAELEVAKSEYEKAKTGIEKDQAVELERLKSAQSTVQIAEAELRLAQNDLAGIEIRAPMSGTILRREAKVGMAFNPNLPGEQSAPLFELADLRDLVVEADVPHHFFSALSIGQPCNVFEQKDLPFYAGKIKSIELHPGGSTHSIRVRVVLDESPRSMGWGVLSSVNVQFLSQNDSVPAK